MLSFAMLLLEGKDAQRKSIRDKVSLFHPFSEVRSQGVHHKGSSCRMDELPKGQYVEKEPHMAVRTKPVARWEERRVANKGK